MATFAKLLIADVDASRAQALAEELTARGYEARVAVGDASSLLEQLKQHDFDVLLCDAQLPVALPSGLLRELRDSSTPITSIILSDSGEGATVMSALRSGASDFFARPLDDLPTLCSAIDRAARQRQMRSELATSKNSLEIANRDLRGAVRALEQDQQAGRQVQLRMLPLSPLVVGDYRFTHTILPSLYLSGDFADYFRVGDQHVVCFLADVSGHGSSSAFITVLLKNLFARKRSEFMRLGDRSILDPCVMLQLANAELLATNTGKYATLIMAVVDIVKNVLEYSVAGHLPLPLLADASGARFLEGAGSPVGMLQDPECLVQRCELPDEFVLALFSDGILEVLPAEGLLEKERYLREHFDTAIRDPQTFLAALMADGAALPDDIAALFVSKRS